MVLAAAACCTNTGKGAFILGTSGSIKNEKLTKLFTDLNYPSWRLIVHKLLPLSMNHLYDNSHKNLK